MAISQILSQMHDFNFNGNETLFAGGVIGIALLFFTITLIIKIFYLFTLSKAIKCCAPECQKMAPSLVWLEIIPFLGMVWAFVNYVQVSGSLGNEFRRRQIPCEDNPAMVIGIVAGALTIGASVFPFAGLAALICWIIYWVKISGYTRTLASGY